MPTITQTTPILLLMSVVALGCGSEPTSGWGFGEGDRDSGLPTLVGNAVLAQDTWTAVDLSDHSTTTTTVRFLPGGELSVDWEHWDVFLDEQPDPIDEAPGQWTVGEVGEVSYEWTLDDRPVRKTHTWIIVPTALSEAMGQAAGGDIWPMDGFLAQGRELRSYQHVWRSERTMSTGAVSVGGGVSIGLRFNAPITELGADCRVSITLRVDRPDESGEISLEQPCALRRGPDGASSVVLTALPDDSPRDAWEAILADAGADQFSDIARSAMNLLDRPLWFSDSRPNMLTTGRFWDALESE